MKKTYLSLINLKLTNTTYEKTLLTFEAGVKFCRCTSKRTVTLFPDII